MSIREIVDLCKRYQNTKRRSLNRESIQLKLIEQIAKVANENDMDRLTSLIINGAESTGGDGEG